MLTRCHNEAIQCVNRRLTEFRSFLMGTSASATAESPVMAFLNETIQSISAVVTKQEQLESLARIVAEQTTTANGAVVPAKNLTLSQNIALKLLQAKRGAGKTQQQYTISNAAHSRRNVTSIVISPRSKYEQQ